jgi:hypothetical protein
MLGYESEPLISIGILTDKKLSSSFTEILVRLDLNIFLAEGLRQSLLMIESFVKVIAEKLK